MEYTIVQNPDGDDPYGDICIYHGSHKIIQLPLDDGPVQDFNNSQHDRALRIVGMLKSIDMLRKAGL